jgi:pimeloyl-ACP methyl ester carboxylesterase
MGRYVCSFLVALVLSISAPKPPSSPNEDTGHLVDVGSNKMFLDCTGPAHGTTVILEAGTGDSSDAWSVVQKQVEQFAHVCSYDRLGLGKSSKPNVTHTADEIVEDLHQLLRAAQIPPPYVMVGHSIGGIYVRKYSAIYPAEVTGMVLVDSAHEEQFSRVSQVSPEWAKRIHDKFPADEQRRQGFLAQDEHLAWNFSGPLVVIEHGQTPPSATSDPMAKQSEVVFQQLQLDLVARSKHGGIRVAQKSGHYVQRDEPELVTQSIKDVLRSTLPTR